MQLTQYTDYGLRLLIVLAREEARGAADGAEGAAGPGVGPGQGSGPGTGAMALTDFAERQRLSYHHVAKVAQALVREGFIVSQRGRGGGVALARPAAEIRVGEVVRALESGFRLADCAHCELRGDCTTSNVLAEALEAFLAVLDRKTLAEAARPGRPAHAPWAA